MTDARYFRLASLLRLRSREGKVEWRATPDDDSFRADFDNLTIEVSERQDPDYPDSPDYIVRILNHLGRLVEEYSHSDLSDFSGDGETAYALLRDLYTSARRNAMGVEGALHRLLEALESDEPPRAT